MLWPRLDEAGYTNIVGLKGGFYAWCVPSHCIQSIFKRPDLGNMCGSYVSRSSCAGASSAPHSVLRYPAHNDSMVRSVCDGQLLMLSLHKMQIMQPVYGRL